MGSNDKVIDLIGKLYRSGRFDIELVFQADPKSRSMDWHM